MTVVPRTISRIRERQEGLSPSPWGWNKDAELCSLADGKIIPIRPHDDEGMENADGIWLPHARKDVSVLLDYIDQLLKEIVELGGSIEDMKV